MQKLFRIKEFSNRLMVSDKRKKESKAYYDDLAIHITIWMKQWLKSQIISKREGPEYWMTQITAVRIEDQEYREECTWTGKNLLGIIWSELV